MTIPALPHHETSVLAPVHRGEAGSIAPATSRVRTAVGTARAAVPYRTVAVPYRTVMVVGMLAVAAAMAMATNADAGATYDTSFVRMMRVMAMIKAALVTIAAAALWWRLARPVTAAFATGYLLGAWSMVAATVLIWQLTSIGAAAVLFHSGELGLLFLAWRDTRS